MRPILLFLMLSLLLSAGLSSAQPVRSYPKKSYPDWIKLKHAESMRCIILKEGPDKIEIETPYGNIQTVERKDIEWLQHEFPPRDQSGIRKLGR